MELNGRTYKNHIDGFNLLPYLTSQVRGDTLELGIQTGESIRPTKDIVYRIKVTVDNRDGVLKPGMPVAAVLGQGQ